MTAVTERIIADATQAIRRLNEVAAVAGHAVIIAHACAVLTRARERAWITGGPPVINAMGLLESALRDGDPGSVAVHTIEAATENLLLVIRRECGHDEAEYVEEGDE